MALVTRSRTLHGHMPRGSSRGCTAQGGKGLEKPGGKYPSEKSLFIDGFAPPSPPMATVFALVLETAFTSVRRSARRVAPFPLICPPILARARELGGGVTATGVLVRRRGPKKGVSGYLRPRHNPP